MRWTKRQLDLLIARANTMPAVPGSDLAEALEEVKACYEIIEPSYELLGAEEVARAQVHAH